LAHLALVEEAHDFEAAFRPMWENRQASRRSASFNVERRAD